MVRPRLAEEGVPVDQIPEEEEDHIDELLAEEMARNPRAFGGVSVSLSTSAARRGDSFRPHPPLHPSTESSSLLRAVGGRLTQSTGSSSLLRAVGGRLPPQYALKRHATRVTIGGDDDSSSPQVISHHHHHTHTTSHAQHASAAVGHSDMDIAPSHDGQHSCVPPSSHHHYAHPPIHVTQFVIGGAPQQESMMMMMASPKDHYHHATPHQQHHWSSTPHHHATQFEIGAQSSAVPEPHHHQPSLPISSFHHPTTPLSSPPPPASHRTHFQIGADERPTERMEGIQDHSIKAPLVVVDGANCAYAYGAALHGTLPSSSLAAASNRSNARPIPDARGIRVACRYFQAADIRVLVVLPASWYQMKPRTASSSDAFMETDHLEAIYELQQAGLLVPSPPTDDDDAYVLTIAIRENVRAANRPQQHGPGFVLSNDLFRDAQRRDDSGQLKEFLQNGNNAAHGPGRISFTFCDMGIMDDHGERELDFVPNPRHPLVSWIERFRVL